MRRVGGVQLNPWNPGVSDTPAPRLWRQRFCGSKSLSGSESFSDVHPCRPLPVRQREVEGAFLRARPCRHVRPFDRVKLVPGMRHSLRGRVEQGRRGLFCHRH